MIAGWILIICTFGYLLLLFGLGWLGERFQQQGKSLVNNPYVYALTLSVFCTAWTYYGSVGQAANGGYSFLTTYLGPTLMAPLMWIIIRKMVRISKVEKISSLADLVSSRYGKSSTLGVLVTIFSLFGIVPYIALQLKAIGVSFDLLTSDSIFTYASGAGNIFADSLLYLTIGLALFLIFFGTRKVETSGQHEGLVTAIAFEAIIKLVAFLILGAFVSWVAFDGPGDIFRRVANTPELQSLISFSTFTGAEEWFWMIFLSMMAILFLPRQFQVAVVENTNENHIKKAIWLFPLYLLVINLFVLPIAFGGRIAFFDTQLDSDMFMLAFPLSFEQHELAVLGYLGGFSAATSMMIVSTFALSTMVTNNILMPAYAGSNVSSKSDISGWLLNARRAVILLILMAAYSYNRFVVSDFSLVSIGLISFVAVAQFAPATLGGLFWKLGNKQGAIVGLTLGFMVWFYTLVLPTIVQSGFLPESIMSEGLFGIALLKPYVLLGVSINNPLLHGMFWSLFLNTTAYAVLSVITQQSSKERNQAELFVDIYKYSADYESKVVWRGQAFVIDLRQLLERILGTQRTEEIFRAFTAQHGSNWQKEPKADARLVNFAERALSGAIGTASARIMIANVVQEDEISMEEVYSILKESQQMMELNKELNRKSRQLKKATDELKLANERLLKLDAQKDDFISTVTHEMKTPLTSIRAFSEILYDNKDLTDEEQEQFLDTIVKETERMGRLINQVLELEKLESGAQTLNLQIGTLDEVIQSAIQSTSQLLKGRTLETDIQLGKDFSVHFDRDRIMQVLLNLLSNAVKYTDEKTGLIKLTAQYFEGEIIVCIEDDGRGIEDENKDRIFHKFFQARDQTRKKPPGTGLGLAISKQIITLHQGKIWVEGAPEQGSKFFFTLPAQLVIDELKVNV